MKSKKRLKIGIFMDNFYPSIDGVVVVIDNLAKMLAKFNDVTLVVPYTESYKEDYKRPYNVHRVKSINVPFSEYNVGKIPLKHSKEFKKLLEEDFDIVHIHSPFTMGLIGLKVAKHLNVPCIATVHTRFDFEVQRIVKSKRLTNQIMKKIIKVFNKCDMCIHVNDTMIEEYKNLGYTKDYAVIYNGTDLAPINSKEIDKSINMVNKLYDLSKNDTVLLFVGRINSVKNIYFILDSLKLLKKDGFKFKMLYVGSGPDGKKLQAKIKESHMDDIITMTGKISSRELLSAIYLRSDLLLFPSVFDTSSLVRIEAAVNGTPGLFINDSMVGGTVKNNYNGYTAELDEEKYKDRIKEIINDKKLLKKVSKTAQKTLGKDWMTIAEETYNEYLKVIQNKH